MEATRKSRSFEHSPVVFAVQSDGDATVGDDGSHMHCTILSKELRLKGLDGDARSLRARI